MHTHTGAHVLITAMTLLAGVICIIHFGFTLLLILMSVFNLKEDDFKAGNLSLSAA